MAAPAVIIKAVASFATDKNARKVIGAVLGVVFLPGILGFMALLSIIHGIGGTNQDIVRYSFTDSPIPYTIPEDVREDIKQMHDKLKLLDEEMENGDYENIDKRLVKAVFYCLFFGADTETDAENKFDYAEFVEQFCGAAKDDFGSVIEYAEAKYGIDTSENNYALMITSLYMYLEASEL